MPKITDTALSRGKWLTRLPQPHAATADVRGRMPAGDKNKPTNRQISFLFL